MTKRLFDKDIVLEPAGLEQKIMNELKNSIPRGIVIFNHQSDDQHNPLDRQLEIYTYFDVSKLSPISEAIAKIKVMCRLSVYDGTLMVRGINRNFPVEDNE